MGVAECVAVVDGEPESDGVRDGDARRESVAVGEPVGDGASEAEPVAVRDAVAVPLAVGEAVGVGEVVGEPVAGADADADAESDAAGVPVPEPEGDDPRESVAVGEGVTLGVRLAVSVAADDGVRDGERVCDAVPVREGEGVGVPEGDGVPEGVPHADEPADSGTGVAVGVGVPVPVPVLDGVGESDPLLVAEGETESVPVRDADAAGVDGGDGVCEGVFVAVALRVDESDGLMGATTASPLKEKLVTVRVHAAPPVAAAKTSDGAVYANENVTLMGPSSTAAALKAPDETVVPLSATVADSCAEAAEYESVTATAADETADAVPNEKGVDSGAAADGSASYRPPRRPAKSACASKTKRPCNGAPKPAAATLRPSPGAETPLKFGAAVESETKKAKPSAPPATGFVNKKVHAALKDCAGLIGAKATVAWLAPVVSTAEEGVCPEAPAPA